MKPDPLTVYCLYNKHEREFFFDLGQAKERRQKLIDADRTLQYHEDHQIIGLEIKENTQKRDLVMALLKREDFMSASWIEVKNHAFPRRIP